MVCAMSRTDPSLKLDHRFWMPAVLWIISLAGAIWAFPTDSASVTWLSFATVGALVAWRRPGHPVGWLLLIDGLVLIGGGGEANRSEGLPVRPGSADPGSPRRQPSPPQDEVREG